MLRCHCQIIPIHNRWTFASKHGHLRTGNNPHEGNSRRLYLIDIKIRLHHLIIEHHHTTVAGRRCPTRQSPIIVPIFAHSRQTNQQLICSRCFPFFYILFRKRRGTIVLITGKSFFGRNLLLSIFIQPGCYLPIVSFRQSRLIRNRRNDIAVIQYSFHVIPLPRLTHHRQAILRHLPFQQIRSEQHIWIDAWRTCNFLLARHYRYGNVIIWSNQRTIH